MEELVHIGGNVVDDVLIKLGKHWPPSTVFSGVSYLSAVENNCIKHAVELEQSFMEGAYNHVLSARQTVRHETYIYFMDLLAKTVSCFNFLHD
ncbi:hypothetical protein CsSME_00050643 [Camellia sinensis var. sinensis]